MKPVMYHYVRPCAEGLPHFPYLALADFERQLDTFASTYGFVGRKAFRRLGAGRPKPLTEFFSPSMTAYATIVTLCCRCSGSAGSSACSMSLPDRPSRAAFSMFTRCISWSDAWEGAQCSLGLRPTHLSFFPAPRDEDATAYASQKSDRATKLVKHLFNWQLSSEERAAALDALLAHAFDGAVPRWDEFYLDREATRELSEAGMGIGPHSHTHEVASRLSARMPKRGDRAFLRLCGKCRGKPPMGLLLSPWGSRVLFGGDGESSCRCWLSFRFRCRSERHHRATRRNSSLCAASA